MKKDLKQIIIGICVVISYFIYSYFQIVPLELIGIDYNSLSIDSKVFYLMITELIYLLILFYIFRNQFKKDFKDFKNNFKPYM